MYIWKAKIAKKQPVKPRPTIDSLWKIVGYSKYFYDPSSKMVLSKTRKELKLIDDFFKMTNDEGKKMRVKQVDVIGMLV